MDSRLPESDVRSGGPSTKDGGSSWTPVRLVSCVYSWCCWTSSKSFEESNIIILIINRPRRVCVGTPTHSLPVFSESWTCSTRLESVLSLLLPLTRQSAPVMHPIGRMFQIERTLVDLPLGCRSEMTGTRDTEFKCLSAFFLLPSSGRHQP